MDEDNYWWQLQDSDQQWQWEQLNKQQPERAGDVTMKVNDVYQSTSSYLKAEDLPKGTRVGVVISSCEVHEFAQDDGSKQKKMVLSFEGKDKRLTLNVTNARMIAANLGSDDTDDWIGKRIELYASQTDFGGKQVPCIRVKEQVPEAVDSDIPF